MPEYRAYLMDGDHIDGPPYVLVADDDGSAIALAWSLVRQNDIELWHLDRFVIRLFPPADPA
jgi:hypothetical protein